MKLKNKNFSNIGLINDYVHVYKTSNELYTLVDDRHEILATWDLIYLIKFVSGLITITTSYGKVYKYTEEHISAKPSTEKLFNFLGIKQL